MVTVISPQNDTKTNRTNELQRTKLAGHCAAGENSKEKPCAGGLAVLWGPMIFPEPVTSTAVPFGTLTWIGTQTPFSFILFFFFPYFIVAYFTKSPQLLHHCCGTFRFRPAYNVTPGFNLPVVRREDGRGGDGDGQGQLVGGLGAIVHCMKWGLIPSFTKKTEKPDHYKMVKIIVLWWFYTFFGSCWFIAQEGWCLNVCVVEFRQSSVIYHWLCILLTNIWGVWLYTHSLS